MQHFQNIETASGLRKFSLQSLFNPMNEYTFIETYLNYLNNRLLDTAQTCLQCILRVSIIFC